MKGIALKVTYNDGGARGGLIGFNGVCSPSNILNNVRILSKTNCSKPYSPCRIYSDGNFATSPPTLKNHRNSWCYESTLFGGGPLRFGAGYYHNGSNAGKPIHVSQVEEGDLALLTTRLPTWIEEDRMVFGCFRVARKPVYSEGWGYAIESDGTMDIKLPDYVAQKSNFWRYYQNSNGSKKCATGLFRYLSEEQTKFFLADLVGLLGDSEERDVLANVLGGNVKPRPIKRLPVVEGNPLGRGYGGGESAAHRNLKNYVAQNPAAVGLHPAAVSEVEFAYLSGDQVDIKFDLPDGTAAIVEIETTMPFPGAHQCVKYRSLLEAARGIPIGSGKVQAILVAHQFDAETRRFASKYDIKLVQLSV